MTTDVEAFDIRQDIAIHREPTEVLAEAQKAAAALTAVLKAKADPVMINGKQYLEFEDWQTVGRFYGVTAKVALNGTEYVQYGDARGFAARAVALRADGMEISAAESICLDDEDKWADRDLFQIKSMAQTRACAKALRNVLAWVVVLAGYGTTPAEEMDGIKGRDKKHAVADRASDGSVLVAEVMEKKGQNSRGPWTKYTVSFDDGTFGTTFDGKLAEEARKAKIAGSRVVPALQEDGKYMNLTGLGAPSVVQAQEQQPSLPDTEPVGQPEKILVVKPVTPEHSAPYWRIQSDRREYVTNLEAVAKTADEFRLAKRHAIIEFDVIQGATGRHNRITEFGEAYAQPPQLAVAKIEAPSAEEIFK